MRIVIHASTRLPDRFLIFSLICDLIRFVSTFFFCIVLLQVLSMCEVLKYLLAESGVLIPSELLEKFHDMDYYVWQKFVDKIKGELSF